MVLRSRTRTGGGRDSMNGNIESWGGNRGSDIGKEESLSTAGYRTDVGFAVPCRSPSTVWLRH